MATLVLTAVGSAIGGPIGGALGALLGQRIDDAVLTPRRKGPRLGDLTVQSSAYGSDIAKLFGTMRVAGTVIWSTELQEHSQRSGNGKTAPKTTTYSYSASFAVALSGRRIGAIGRVWADGKLLRGQAGDWKSELGAFRVYPGDERQAVDPLIAATEGSTPAYRGIGYVVFEDLQLADFGNRIPSLSFEVTADAGPIGVAEIARVLSDGAVTGTSLALLAGYAASGDSVRGAIEALTQAIPVSVRDDGTRLVLGDGGGAAGALDGQLLGAARALDDQLLGAHVAGKAVRRARTRTASDALPDEIALRYLAPERDWQAGLQRARRGSGAARIETIDLPAAIAAATAKALAERRLAQRWTARATATAQLPWTEMFGPGETVSSVQLGATYRVVRWTLERMVVSLDLVREAHFPLVSVVANPGRATHDADRVAGETVLHVLDLPPLEDAPLAAPRLWIVAAGTQPGWRRAALSISLDGGARWQPLGASAAPAVMGATVSALAAAAGGSALFDLAGMVEVELVHDGMWLEPRDDAALMAGANLALLGDELVQFGRAVPIGPNRFRLSRLLRGRRGTEWAAGAHAAGARFVLIEAGALVAYDPPVGAIGGQAQVMAHGIGDAAAVIAGVTIAGDAVRPPSPIALRAVEAADGALAIRWTRRSRAGWGWADGGDAPLGEEAERYRVTIAPAGGAVRRIECDAPLCVWSAAMRAADGGGAPVAIGVVQRGTFAPSRAATIRF